MTGCVVILIFIDLLATIVNNLIEHTDLLNPKYHHEGHLAGHLSHIIGVSVLSIFLVEQFLRMLAFGWSFFSHGWYVCDLVVVSGSLVMETVLEGSAIGDLAAVAMLSRLWMLVAFCFDICLAQHEERERREVPNMTPNWLTLIRFRRVPHRLNTSLSMNLNIM